LGRVIPHSRVTHSRPRSSLLSSIVGMLRTRLRDGLVLDGDAACQFVHSALGVPWNKLVLVGHSLGGAVATQVARNYPAVAVCNTRSFGRLSDVVRTLAADYLGFVPTSARGRLLCRAAPWVTAVLGWEYSTVAAWPTLQGFKWVEYCPADAIIRPETSLVAALRGWEGRERELTAMDASAAAGAVAEGGDAPHILTLQPLRGLDNHNRAYTSHELRAHLQLVARALDLPLPHDALLDPAVVSREHDDQGDDDRVWTDMLAV